MTSEPTTRHAAKYRNAAPDGRIFNTTFDRNNKPVTDGLVSFLGDRVGNALEIGSGTGQNICALAHNIPALNWTASDPDRMHRASIIAWQKHTQAPLRAVLDLDAASDWPASPDVAAITRLQLVFSMNVIHVAPFAVAQGIVSGAAKTLDAGGYLVFYGPFREQGQHTGNGNRIFDTRLRADNPEWGVRDTGDLGALATQAGLAYFDLIEMPANNRLLVFISPVSSNVG